MCSSPLLGSPSPSYSSPLGQVHLTPPKCSLSPCRLDPPILSLSDPLGLSQVLL